MEIINSLLLGVRKAQQLRKVNSCVEFQPGDSDLVVARFSVGDLLVLGQTQSVLDSDQYARVLHYAAHIIWPETYLPEDVPPEERPAPPPGVARPHHLA